MGPVAIGPRETASRHSDGAPAQALARRRAVTAWLSLAFVPACVTVASLGWGPLGTLLVLAVVAVAWLLLWRTLTVAAPAGVLPLVRVSAAIGVVASVFSQSLWSALGLLGVALAAWYSRPG